MQSPAPPYAPLTLLDQTIMPAAKARASRMMMSTYSVVSCPSSEQPALRPVKLRCSTVTRPGGSCPSRRRRCSGAFGYGQANVPTQRPCSAALSERTCPSIKAGYGIGRGGQAPEVGAEGPWCFVSSTPRWAAQAQRVTQSISPVSRAIKAWTLPDASSPPAMTRANSRAMIPRSRKPSFLTVPAENPRMGRPTP